MVPRDLVRVIWELAQNDFSVFQDLNLEHVLDIVVPLVGARGVDFVELGADVIGAGHDPGKLDLDFGLYQLPCFFIAEGDGGEANRAGGHVVDINSKDKVVHIRVDPPLQAKAQLFALNVQVIVLSGEPGFQHFDLELAGQIPFHVLEVAHGSFVPVHRQVPRNTAGGIAVIDDLTVIQYDDAGAESLDGAHIVADVKNGAVIGIRFVAHLAKALILELGIADGEDFVHDHDLAVEVSGDREGELDVHAGGIALDRRVDELGHFGKLDDLVKLPVDLGLRHAEDRAVEVDVLPTGELWVEAGADFKHGGNAAAQDNLAAAGCGDARNQL